MSAPNGPPSLDALLEKFIAARLQLLAKNAQAISDDAQALLEVWGLYLSNEAVTDAQIKAILAQTSEATEALKNKAAGISTEPPVKP